ncbi:thrombomodulin-like [Takifugu rubripes]|uniref:thrombomodulin-like n=1 Tax=Takifugu rubripes TaxID=31033 RepID=UPI0011455BBC|nr:thrombomodulin-like [Takifugu rubripes]
MNDVTRLIAIVCALLWGRTGGVKPNNIYCIGNQCFTVSKILGDFSAAQSECQDRGGNLMTVRSSVAHDVPFNVTGRRQQPVLDRFTSTDGPGDNESDFSNWPTTFNSSCSSHRCVSVSPADGFKWTREPCDTRTDGFLCEYSFNETCKYTAVRMPTETKYICFSGQWTQAPWNCDVLGGGCEERLLKLAADGRSCVDFNDCTDPRQCPGENSRCVNTAGGFQCVCKDGYRYKGGVCVDVNECTSAPCEHMCDNLPGSYVCSCYPGYKEDPEEPHRCKLHCGEEECLAECDPNDRYQCFCPEGYILGGEDNRTLSAWTLDECSSFYCDQDCEKHLRQLCVHLLSWI